MKQAGKTQGEIAQAIGFSQSTVSNELSRNHGERGYRPSQAHRLAMERKSLKRTRPKVMTGILKDAVEARLRIKHSPDQISKSLALRDLRVSHETIYQHIAADRKAGGDLSLNLRINGRRRLSDAARSGAGRRSRTGWTSKKDRLSFPTGHAKGTGRRTSFREGREVVSYSRSMSGKVVSEGSTCYLTRAARKP